MSEERTIGERLAGLETQQKGMGETLSEIKSAMKDMTDAFTQFMSRQAGVDARLLAIEQDLRDGRSRFKAHDAAIQTMQSRCDQNEGLRVDGKKHLDESKGQDREVHGALWTARSAERMAWALLSSILGVLLWLATRAPAGGP